MYPVSLGSSGVPLILPPWYSNCRPVLLMSPAPATASPFPVVGACPRLTVATLVKAGRLHAGAEEPH